jgi:hypothetical protein
MDDSPALAAQFTASKHPTALGVACGAGAEESSIRHHVASADLPDNPYFVMPDFAKREAR